MTTLQTHADTPMPLRVARVIDAAEGIRSFELVQPDGTDLPSFAPGSHVKVQVPNGLLRKYSLCNDPARRDHYLITVKRDAQGQGGSLSLCDEVREGDVLPTSVPDNAFLLVEEAKGYIFIAGGIGITPFLSMIRSFGEHPPTPWKLYYLARSPESTAFLQELGACRYKGEVVVHHDHGDPSNSLDLWPVLERPKAGTHIYCCGPRGLMESVRDMAGHWPSSNVHFESFSEGGGVRQDDKPFVVRLAKTSQSFEVPVGNTILGVLRELGYKLPSSCESGTCGSCRTKLVSGEADHRDMVLMPEELDSQIMICVSRAKAGELVVDL